MLNREEIDNPGMRGRKLESLIRAFFLFGEEIDNPRMRGRKPMKSGRTLSRSEEEIAAPRMRGPQREHQEIGTRLNTKKLIIPG